VTAQRATGLSAAAWRGAAGLGAAALLRSSFAAKAGSTRFYLLTAGLAGTWTGGALGAGPIPWRGDGWRTRPASATRTLIVVPVVTGTATFAVFYGAARIARRHRTLRRAIASVLRYADAGWSGSRPLRTTTLAYAASTAATGNPALLLAGLVTSVIFGWQRAATGGVLAPAVTHLTWSVLMLRYLPPLFRDADRPPVPPGHPAKAAPLGSRYEGRNCQGLWGRPVPPCSSSLLPWPGRRSLDMVLDSIWRMRSRVTP